MVTRSLLAVGLAVLLATAFLLAPATTWAESVPSAEPALHHAPVSVASAGEQLSITAGIDHPEMVRSAFLVYRIGSAADVHEVRFLRAAQGPYIAVIPEGDVRSPSIGYTVELEPLTGGRQA